MKLPCPSCKRDIESEERICPYCEWRIQGVDHHPSPKRGGSFQGIVLMTVSGGLLWIFFMRPDVVAKAKYRALALVSPHLQRLGVGAAPAAPVAAPPIERKTPEGVEMPPPPKAEPKPAEPVQAAAESYPVFQVAGSVFDLITLKPVFKAKVVFTDTGTQEKRETATGPDGSFSLELAANMDGWDIQVRHDDYDRKYSEDWKPSLRSFAEERRAEAAATIRSRKGERVHILGREGDSVQKDLAVIPRNFQ